MNGGIPMSKESPQRTFNQRETFIAVLAIMKTSPNAQAMSKEQIQTLVEYIRLNHCQDISYDEWLEIEKNIIQTKHLVMDTLIKGVFKALGAKPAQEKELVLFKKMEAEFRDYETEESLQTLKDMLKEDKSETSQLIKQAITQFEKSKKDRDNERKSL